MHLASHKPSTQPLYFDPIQHTEEGCQYTIANVHYLCTSPITAFQE